MYFPFPIADARTRSGPRLTRSFLKACQVRVVRRLQVSCALFLPRHWTLPSGHHTALRFVLDGTCCYATWLLTGFKPPLPAIRLLPHDRPHTSALTSNSGHAHRVEHVRNICYDVSSQSARRWTMICKDAEAPSFGHDGYMTSTRTNNLQDSYE